MCRFISDLGGRNGNLYAVILRVYRDIWRCSFSNFSQSVLKPCFVRFVLYLSEGTLLSYHFIHRVIVVSVLFVCNWIESAWIVDEVWHFPYKLYGLKFSKICTCCFYALSLFNVYCTSETKTINEFDFCFNLHRSQHNFSLSLIHLLKYVKISLTMTVQNSEIFNSLPAVSIAV